METGWLTFVGEWASAWPAGLWRASWQGALCAALVWALTRAWPRMPASLRAGLWWLVALKFVVSLGWVKPVPLPLLPAPEARPEEAGLSRYIKERPRVHRESVHLLPVEAGAAPGTVASVGAAPLAGPIAGGTSSREPSRLTGEAGFIASAVRSGEAVLGSPPSGPAEASVPWWRVGMLALLAAWAVGVLWQVVGHVKGWASMRRVRRSARPLEHPGLQADLRALSQAAGLWRVPGLLVSDSVASPLATGVLSPVVVLPARAVRRLPVEALRMALAHELAHLRRGDLWLGWVPALAEALLFFHPLARRAAREYALAREEACDADALRLTGAEPADYGELLLAFGVARGAGTAAALGASAHVQALHRRLSMLEHVDAVPARPRRLLKVALSALGLAALVPFQVVAQEAASKPAAAPAATPQAAKPAAAPSAPAQAAKPGAPAPAKPAAPAAPATASAPAAPPAPPTPRVGAVPPAPPAPRVAAVAPVPPVPPVP
ncbi:MAG TPA: M56 family metallopeptidase, partial [Myxococcus sp.]|nr:M56 family metallopeptidase [Myxococcus sp.]